MAKKKEDATIALSVEGADPSAIDIKKVTGALENFGDVGAKLQTPVTRSLEAIQAEQEKFSKKTIEGRKVNDSELNAMIQSFVRMEAAVKATGLSIEQLPAEVQQAMQQAKSQMSSMADAVYQTQTRASELKNELIALAAEQERAAELAAEVTEEYGKTAESIDELKKSGDKTFAEQKEGLEKIQKELKEAEPHYKKMGTVGAEAFAKLRTESDRVAKAISDLSSESTTKMGKVRDGVVLTDRAFENFTKTLSTNPKEALEQIPKLAGSVIQLRNSINAARAAGSPVDDEALAKLKSFEKGLESARFEASALKKEIDKASGGSAAWQGFDSVIEGVAGKFGKAGTAALGATAALKEGWAVGKQIAAAIGTDFSAMEHAIDSFTSKAGGVNASILSWLKGDDSFEAVRASIGLTKEQFEAYNSAVLAGIKDLGDITTKTAEFNQIHAAHTIILAEGFEGQKLASQAKKDGAGVLADYVTSLNVASEAAKVHHKLLQQGAEGEQLWNEIRAQGKGGLLELAQAISDNSGRISELTRKTQDQIEAERALQAAVNDTSASIERRLAMEKQQAELIANQEKVEDGLTASLRNKLAEISASMVVKEGKEIPLTKLQISQFESLLVQTTGLSDAERKRHGQLLERMKTVETMTQYEREALAQEIQRQLLINTTTFTDEAHRVVLDKKTKTISNAAAATSSLNDAQVNVTTSSGRAMEAGEKLRGGFGRLAEGVGAVERGVHGFGEGLSSVSENVDAHVAKMEQLIDVFKRTGDAADTMREKVSKASKAGLDEED